MRATGSAMAKQAFEEIAEIPHATLAETLGLLLPAGRRTELFARAIAAGPQLVVGAPLFGVAQYFVGLVDGLEFLLGARVLVAVGVVFARQLAIRRLDLGFAGIRLDAQDLVLVFEFHRHSVPPAAQYSAKRRDGLASTTAPGLTSLPPHHAGLSRLH
jgi:hypothetical protein